MRPKINDIRSHPYFSAPVQSPLPPPAAKRELVGILNPLKEPNRHHPVNLALFFDSAIDSKNFIELFQRDI